MPSVYILYSPSFDRYYIGATTVEVDVRVERHTTGYYENKFTAFAKDWEVFFLVDCSSMQQALKIESHIKKMKSRKYLHNLKLYPEMIEKLKEKYQ